METTIAGNGQYPETSARQQEVSALIADVQELLWRVGHLADPEITLLRTKVENGISAAKHTLAEGSTTVRRSAREALSAGDGFVRDHSWQAVGIAAVAGVLVGFLAARR